jgi:GGDEF domain-containing protein
VFLEVSRRLQNSVRSYDMVGRYGEEFLVMLNRYDPRGGVCREPASDGLRETGTNNDEG